MDTHRKARGRQIMQRVPATCGSNYQVSVSGCWVRSIKSTCATRKAPKEKPKLRTTIEQIQYYLSSASLYSFRMHRKFSPTFYDFTFPRFFQCFVYLLLSKHGINGIEDFVLQVSHMPKAALIKGIHSVHI